MAVGNILGQPLKTSEIEKKMLLKKIKEMQNLPMPSANVMKVMLLLRDEDVKMYHLIPAIEKDQVLVAQILKLINSGYYGLRKTIDSVERAVNLLGILNIKHIVYSASIMDLFTDEEKVEWDHAYSASVLMSSILKENEIPAESNLPLSMLMHDIGKVVLRRFSPKKYQMVLNHSENDKIPSFKVEEALFQLTHADAAGILMEKWEMTEELIKPVTYHHRDDVPEDYVMETCLIQFVNWVDCTARGILCLPPSRELLAAAGFEEIDKTYWVDYQRKFIEDLEGEQKKEKHISSGTLTRPAKEPKTVKAPPVTVSITPADVTAEDDEAPVEVKPLSDKELEFLKRIGKTSVQTPEPQHHAPPKAAFDAAAAVPPPDKTNESTDVTTVIPDSDTAKVDRNHLKKKSAETSAPHPTEKTKRLLHEEPKGFWGLIKSFFGFK